MLNIPNGKDLYNEYNSNTPFPHIAIDNFLPEGILRSAYQSLSQISPKNWGWDELEWIKPYQQNKFQLNDEVGLYYPPVARDLIKLLNSKFIVNFLQDLTGISDLVIDPTISGGGVHKITNGGKLNIHTDYGKHPQFEDLYRRINLLLYLNPNWKKEWGGELHFKTEPTGESQSIISPLFNRAVIFNTTDVSWHGHPDPLNCPEDEARYSIAMYYFTKELPDFKVKNFVNFY